VNSQQTFTAPSSPDLVACTGDFGVRVRAARIASGRSQAEIAELAGIAPSYLCGIERSLRPAPAEQIVDRLVAALALRSDDAALLALAAGQSRTAWRGRARSRRAGHSAQDQVSGCLTQAIDAMRQGWCSRVEVIAPGEGLPVRLVIWGVADESMEAAM